MILEPLVRVRLLVSLAGPDQSFSAGSVAAVTPADAARLIARQLAEPLPFERATRLETAVRRKGSRR